jgi:hypothetical protein
MSRYTNKHRNGQINKAFGHKNQQKSLTTRKPKAKPVPIISR